jgi:hypothetical protein
MSLRKVFIIEGQQDSTNRQMAVDLFYSVIDHIRSRPMNVGSKSLKIPKGSLSSAENLSFVFKLEENKKQVDANFYPTKDGTGALIEIVIPIEMFYDSNEGFAEYLTINNGDIRDAMIHELTHYLDWKRIGHSEWSKMSHKNNEKTKKMSPDSQLTQYYREPTEQNAFFQQTADYIQQEWSPEMVANMDINGFYNGFVSRMQKLAAGAPGKYRERQIPNLKKRVAQLYNDIRSRTSG